MVETFIIRQISHFKNCCFYIWPLGFITQNNKTEDNMFVRTENRKVAHYYQNETVLHWAKREINNGAGKATKKKR